MTKLKVLKYDKPKARWYFALYKFLEVFGLFLLLYGFAQFGRFVYKITDNWMGMNPTIYFDFWFYGVASLIAVMLLIALIAMVLSLFYSILKAWIKGNWRLAQKSAEDKEAKLERISEQNKLDKIEQIEELEKQRKKYGYCVGDKMIDGDLDGVWEITCINSDDTVDIKRGKYSHVCRDFNKNKGDKIVEKISIPKKPKLNKIRQREVKK